MSKRSSNMKQIIAIGFGINRFTAILAVSLLLLAACSSKDKEAATRLPDIPFGKSKWSEKTKEGSYSFRKQMVNDVIRNYAWTGVKKDSVVSMLGKPDEVDHGNLLYHYERKPMLGGIGTAIESIVFEISPDSTVKKARFSEGGWD